MFYRHYQKWQGFYQAGMFAALVIEALIFWAWFGRR